MVADVRHTRAMELPTLRDGDLAMVRELGLARLEILAHHDDAVYAVYVLGAF